MRYVQRSDVKLDRVALVYCYRPWIERPVLRGHVDLHDIAGPAAWRSPACPSVRIREAASPRLGSLLPCAAEKKEPHHYQYTALSLLLPIVLLCGCNSRRKASSVVIRVLRDLRSPYGSEFDRRILDFQGSNPKLSSGQRLIVRRFGRFPHRNAALGSAKDMCVAQLNGNRAVDLVLAGLSTDLHRRLGNGIGCDDGFSVPHEGS